MSAVCPEMTISFSTGCSCRSNRGSFHPSVKERGHEAYNRSLASLNTPAGPIRESQDLKRDNESAEVSQGRALNQPGESPSVGATSSSVVLQRCTRSNFENPLNQQNKYCHGLDSLLNSSAQEPRHAHGNRKSSNRGTESTSMNSEISGTSTSLNACDETNSRIAVKESETSKEKDISEKSQPKMDRHKSEREQRETAKSGCGSGSGQSQHHDPVTLRKSGHSRSPSSHPQHVSLSTLDSSRLNADVQSRKEEFRHKQERQSGHRGVSGSRSEKSSSDKLHRKTEIRGTREHHRKEERRQEGTSSSERRRTRSDGIKEYQHRRGQSDERNRADEKKSNRGERRSTRSETSKEPERQSGKDSGATRGVDKVSISDGKEQSRADVREHALPVKPQCSAQNLRKDQDDQRTTSGRTEESSRSKASSNRAESKGDTCTSSYIHSGKESVKGRSDKEKRNRTPDIGSNTAPDNAKVPKTSADGNIQTDAVASAARLPGSCNSSAVPEESSPKRKLTFMETLNLTVSPIKKQTNCKQTKEPVQPPPEDTPVINFTKDSSFEIGEEFCVIDEVIDDSLTLPTNATTQPHDNEPAPSLEVKGKELELPRRFNGDLNSLTLPGNMDGTGLEMQEDFFVNTDVISTSIFQKYVVDKTALPEVSLHPEKGKINDSPSVLLTDVGSKKQDSQASLKKHKERRMLDAKTSSEKSQTNNEPEALVQNNPSQQEVATSILVSATAGASNTNSLVVSSTVCVENHHQSKETIDVLDMEIRGVLENLDPCPGPLVGPSAQTIDVITTTQEDGLPLEQASSSEPDSTENEMEISRPSCSVVLPHDEDSMMLTLSNIKVIPDAISPLTSPVRQIKKSQQQRLGKEPHVKSLSKGQFSVWVFLCILWFRKRFLKRGKKVFWFVLWRDVLCRGKNKMVFLSEVV